MCSRYNEVVRRTGILSMLTHNRADFYIDALTEVDYVVKRPRIRRSSVAPTSRNCRCICALPRPPRPAH